MLFKSRFFRAASACGLVLAMSFSAFADTIRMKDGSVIKGKIVSFAGGTFTVVVGEGTSRRREMNYGVADIESISFEPNAAPGTSNGVATTNAVSAGKNPISANDNRTSNPPVSIAPQINQNSGGTSSTGSSNAAVALPPITLNVKVLADNTSNGWTDSKFVVRKGQRIRISAGGQISLGGGNYATPKGIATLADAQKLIAQSPTGGLIAVVGDDNNDFIFIGSEREFVATRDGALFLGVNEGNLNDNSGKFDVKIEIQP